MSHDPVLCIERLSKRFVLHNQDGAVLNVISGMDLQAAAGEIVALCGPSGAGKSSLLKAVYGTYRVNGGRIVLRHGRVVTDIAAASPREIVDLREHAIGYVSQFLRVIPRVPALEIVAEPAIGRNTDRDDALARAKTLLNRLRIPENLWSLSPLTFSGGEQQRVNIARAMCAPKPLMLFDEPTASLDRENRETVLNMIGALRDNGHAVIGIFHNGSERRALNAREVDVRPEREMSDA